MNEQERRRQADRAYYLKGGKERMRAQHLKRVYGITLAHYRKLHDRKLHDRQHGLCAICGQPETRRHRSGELYQLAVDHDHETNHVRGLLCADCNQALGLMRDDVERLRAAANYLKKQQRQTTRQLSPDVPVYQMVETSG